MFRESKTVSLLINMNQEFSPSMEVMDARVKDASDRYGPFMPPIEETLRDTASNACKSGACDEARSCYRALIGIQSKMYGPVSAPVAETLFNLAGAEMSMKLYGDSAASLQQSLRIFDLLRKGGKAVPLYVNDHFMARCKKSLKLRNLAHNLHQSYA